MKRETIDRAAVQCARLGCPEDWTREFLAEAGLAMTDLAWRRYWQAATKLAREDTRGPAA